MAMPAKIAAQPQDLPTVRVSITHDGRENKLRMKIHLNQAAMAHVGKRIRMEGDVLTGLRILHDPKGRKISSFGGARNEQRGFISLSQPAPFLGFEPNGVTEYPVPLEVTSASNGILTSLIPREAIVAKLGPIKALRTTKKVHAPKSKYVAKHALATLPVISPLVSPDDERRLANAILNINEAVKRGGLMLSLRDGLLEAALPVKWRKLGS